MPRKTQKKNKRSNKKYGQVKLVGKDGKIFWIDSRKILLEIVPIERVFGFLPSRSYQLVKGKEFLCSLAKKCYHQPCVNESSLEDRSKLKLCENCLTCYCSKECQREDWENHKQLCYTSKAYDSKMKHFEYDILDHSSLVQPLEQWKEWVKTPEILKTLKRCHLRIKDVHPPTDYDWYSQYSAPFEFKIKSITSKNLE